MADEIFQIKGFGFTYPEQTEKALDGITLGVRRGEFFVLCGPSGCGKSTLLRQLKPAIAPHGLREGEIFFDGTPLPELPHREQAERIGFVLQSPENQIVTDKVWHELAFGLESLGCDTPTIRRRVAEMASFFGIQTWFYKDVAELSGGQKQLLNLASVMVMQPSVLILDEPTSQLDPIAASDFLATLGRINRELGTTVILTEHRLEEAFSLCSRAAVMERGRLICAGTPGEVGRELLARGSGMFLGMPSAMRVWAGAGGGGDCPVTVRDGRQWLGEFAKTHELFQLPGETQRSYPPENALELEEVWFRYVEELPDVVKGLSLTLRRGELLALLGGNGTGKTTTLRLASGLAKPYRGSVAINGSVGLLPQDPQTVFVKKTVREDLREMLPRGADDNDLARVVSLCRLDGLLERHPYDLSGGEQQRAALAKLLLSGPGILLLDEPTKGLDAQFKQTLAGILAHLTESGVSILMVSHDVEFCAQYAHRCALFFDGGIVTSAPPRRFFSGNSFYTTAVDRMSRDTVPGAVTVEELVCACTGRQPEPPVLPETEYALPEPETEKEQKAKKLPRWRKLTAAVSLTAALALLVYITKITDLTELISAGGITPQATVQLGLYAAFIALLAVFALSIGRRSTPPVTVQTPKDRRRLSRRTIAAAVLIVLLIPLTLFVGVVYLGNGQYYLIAFLVLIECMAPFFMVFERRKPQARELVVIAVLCAIGVAGRAAFFMLPQFKPVMALTIIAGVAFGGETGFLVGAMTMLVSNILFSQGPWTPWQMFAMGIVGFLAGVLFRKGLLRRSRGSLCVFGALSAIIVYGGIVNPVSALLWSRELSWSVVLPYYVTGFPMDCVHAAATVIFLWLAAEPMLEKLDRIKVKYGLVE